MKKSKRAARWLSLALALIMALGMCACSGEGDSKGESKGNTSGKTKSADQNLAKQYVFASEELDLPLDGADDIGFQGMQRMGDRIYMLINLYDYDSYDSVNPVKLVSLKADGSDVQGVTLQLPESDTQTGNAGEDGASGEDGDTASGGGADIPDGEVIAFDEDDLDSYDGFYEDYSYEEVYEYTGYQNFCISSAGKVYGIKYYSYSDYTNPDAPVYEEDYSLCCWDMEGNFQWERALDGIGDSGEEYVYVRNLLALDDGDVILMLSGEATYKVTVGEDGELSGRTKLPVATEKMENIYDMLPVGNGEFLITYYDNDWTTMYMATYDIKDDSVSEGKALPFSFAWNGYNALTTGASTDLAYADYSGVWGLNVGEEEPVQIMSMINSDIANTYFYNLIMLDDDHFIAFYNDELQDYRTVGALFTRRDPEDIPDKEVLILAGMYLDSDVRRRVVEFNKSSDSYRIVTKEYESMATADDYMAGYTQLNNEIIAGNMPDILVYDGGLQMQSYINKGLLADVGELIEQDEELSGMEYLTNVFDAYRVDGKLYQVIPSFVVQTFIAKTSLVGDRDSWTFKDLEEVMKTMPEGAAGFGEMDKTTFLYSIMNYCGNDFVDPSTGKCDFDSQNFIDMLQYADNFPDEIDYGYYDSDWENWWLDYQSQYRENRTLLMNAYIYSFSDMNYYVNGYFGEDVSYVGFPTESGNGSILSMSGSQFVLSAKSANLDGAWEFVRYYLTDEYQDALQGQLPVSKKAFDRLADEATQKPYYLDEDGNKVEYDNYFDINGESVPLDPLSREQVDQLKSCIESVHTVSYYNEDIYNIISEEAASFFTHQKSAEEVAGVIQSRVQIYVDENR